MKRRIDIRQALADPLHGLRIAVQILLLALVLLSLEVVLLQGAGWGDPLDGVLLGLSMAQPPVWAGGIEVQEGIDQFNGHSNRGVWNVKVTAVLTSLIGTYVLGPALFAWGLRARARWRRNALGSPGVRMIALALTAGGLSVLLMATAPIFAVKVNATHKIMTEDCQLAAERDGMSSDLFQMARRAQVVFFLPGDKGGGNHSWLAGDGSGRPAIDMSRLLLPAHPGALGPYSAEPGSSTKYSLCVERADSLTIIGICTERATNGVDCPVITGPRGRIEMCVGVTPDRVNLVFIN